ncbi:MAG: hypothetical protein M1142_05990 [Patescibacteria group bacterium]|nr:hypothetical protein [Patescibacteria group bacterium]
MPRGGEFVSRNVSIVVILLILVVIAGYLIWLRSRVQSSIAPRIEQQVQVTPTPIATATASPSATPKEASGSVKQKTATPSVRRR